MSKKRLYIFSFQVFLAISASLADNFDKIYTRSSNDNYYSWSVDSIAQEADRDVYKNDTSGMLEMAFRRDDLSFVADWKTND